MKKHHGAPWRKRAPWLAMCLWPALAFSATGTEDPLDPFYDVTPSELSGEHGTVIRHRPLEGPAALEGAAANILVIYRSAAHAADVNTKLTAVSGIVALPPGPPPVGGWPVVSWAHGTVGLADKCAPSMDSDALGDITDPTNPPLTIHRKINRAPHDMLNAFLAKGWAVVMTDYEGLGTRGTHPYLYGETEGLNVLDIATAARRLLNNESTTVLSDRIAVIGHSQGGQAALFAGSLSPTWAPDLKLVGVEAIAPGSNQQNLPWLALLGPTPDLPFLPMAIVGALRDSPDIDLDQIFTASGRELFDTSMDRYCRIELSSQDLWAKPGENYFKVGIWPRLDAALGRMHPNLPIQAPVRISQGVGDTRVPVDQTRNLVGGLNETNPDLAINYMEYENGEIAEPDPVSLGDHMGILKTDIDPTVDWLDLQFSKAP